MIKVASHLYRNRHGTFYFRFAISRRLRKTAGRCEVRLSLGTEQRQEALAVALPLVADLPRLVGDLCRMSENNEPTAPDYFKQWKEVALENSVLRSKVKLLKDELSEVRDRMGEMVPREKLKQVGKIMHERGALRGKQELEERLVFPWPPEKTKLFSELLASYMKHFAHRPKGGVRKQVGAKTLDGYEKDLQLFITIMGNVRIGGIDREVAGEYFSILCRLPANMNRVARYRGKSISELLAMKEPPQSEANASKKLERASGMFKWALVEKRKWGIDANPFTGFGQASDYQSKRRPFTHDELKLLFGHEDFANREFPRSYMYWLMPLAIFTGARLGELAQLDLKDFVQVDAIDCIDVNDIDARDIEEEGGRAKRVKTKNAKRLVPIHPELIRMGLLRHVERMRQRGEVSLFPELSRSRRDGPSHAASNWFQRFRADVGLTEKQATRSGISSSLSSLMLGTRRICWRLSSATKRSWLPDGSTGTRRTRRSASRQLMPSPCPPISWV